MQLDCQIVGKGNLNGAQIKRQDDIDLRIQIIGRGLSGAELGFVAKLNPDDDDAAAIINYRGTAVYSTGGIIVDPNSSNTIMVARMRIHGSITTLLPPGTVLYYGFQITSTYPDFSVTTPDGAEGTFSIVKDIFRGA